MISIFKSKILVVFLFALAYAFMGWIGLTLAIPPGYASPVFPAAGLALACVLWFGPTALAGVWLGSALLNLSHAGWLGLLTPSTAIVAIAIATGATLQAWVGSWLVGLRQGPAWRTLEHEQDVLGFLLLGGVLSGVISSSIGVTALQAFGVIEGAEFLFNIWNWYIGDVLGVLVFAPLTLCLLNREGEMWRDRRRCIVMPMLFTLGLVTVAFYGASRWERQSQSSQLQADSEILHKHIADRLIAHREVLSSLKHFIEATPDFSFKQFELFTRITLQDNPDIFALSFNDLIADEKRAAFESMMSRLSPVESFQITERNAAGKLIRAMRRPEYVTVRYIVPLANNQPAVGYDINSEPLRRDAINRARASGAMAVTAPIRLVQEQRQRVGILELLPVISAKAVPANDQSARLIGFAVGVIKVDEMIDIAIKGHVPADLVFQLIDPHAPDGQNVLYQFGRPTDTSIRPGRPAPWKTTLRVGDREWELSVHATEEYRRRHRTWLAWIVGVVGLSFTALLQILMLGMTGRTAIIQHKNEALRYRLELEKLVSAISTDFVKRPPVQIDSAIDNGLRAIGVFADVDRSYVFQISGNGTTMDNTHEWCAEGIEPQKGNLQGLPVEIIPWWMGKLNRFETIYIPRVDDLPPEADAERKILQEQNILSLVVVPLVYGKSLVGFLGFDSVRKEKTWTEEDIALLKLVGEILVNTLEHKRAELALRIARDRAQSYLETVDAIIVALDRKGRITLINRKGCQLFGREEDDLIGQDWFTTCLPQPYGIKTVYPVFLKLIAGEIESLEYFENSILTPNGEQRQIAWHNALLRDEQGQVVGTLSAGEDITQRKQAEAELARHRDRLEELVKERTTDLEKEIAERKQAEERIRAALEEKDVLLREVHHRVKNNLNTIANLLYFQAKTVEDKKAMAAFQDSQNRIHSMARVHEHLYRSESLARVNMVAYFRDLVSDMQQTSEASSVSIRVNAAKEHLDIDQAIPCGLIVNELVTNALKYAFPEGVPNRQNEVIVQLITEATKHILEVRDNGIGLPAGLDIEKSRSLGLRLVSMLTRQLKGQLTIDTAPGHGAKFTLIFAGRNYEGYPGESVAKRMSGSQ